MSIPYRTQQNIKRAAVTLLVLLVVGSLLWGLWFLWLQRYVVYTRDGAVIDFALSETLAPGQVATPPEDTLQVEIHYNEGDDMVSISKELTQLKGYYITAEDLTADPACQYPHYVGYEEHLRRVLLLHRPGPAHQQRECGGCGRIAV